MQFDPNQQNAVHVMQANQGRAGLLIQGAPTASYQQSYVAMPTDPSYPNPSYAHPPQMLMPTQIAPEMLRSGGMMTGPAGLPNMNPGLGTGQMINYGGPSANIRTPAQHAQVMNSPHHVYVRTPNGVQVQNIQQPPPGSSWMSQEQFVKYAPNPMAEQMAAGSQAIQVHIPTSPARPVQGISNVQAITNMQSVQNMQTLPSVQGVTNMHATQLQGVPNVQNTLQGVQNVQNTPQIQSVPSIQGASLQPSLPNTQNIQNIQSASSNAAETGDSAQFSSPIQGIPLYSQTPVDNSQGAQRLTHNLPPGVQVVNVDTGVAMEAQSVAMQASPAFVQPIEQSQTPHPSIYQASAYIGSMQNSQLLDSNQGGSVQSVYSIAQQNKPSGIYIVPSVQQKTGVHVHSSVSNGQVMSNTMLSTAVNSNNASSLSVLQPNAMLQSPTQSVLQTTYVVSPPIQNCNVPSSDIARSSTACGSNMQALPSISSFAAMANLSSQSSLLSNSPNMLGSQSISLSSDPPPMIFNHSQSSQVANKSICQTANSSQSTISVTVTGTIATASLVTVASRINGNQVVHSSLSNCQHFSENRVMTTASDQSAVCVSSLPLCSIEQGVPGSIGSVPDSSESISVNQRIALPTSAAPGRSYNTPHAIQGVGKGPAIECKSVVKPSSTENTPTSSACVTVPYGWQRNVENGSVVYYSPSKTELKSAAEIRQYLTKDDTCKCGLECPLLVEKVFNFEPAMPCKLWTSSEASSAQAERDLTKLCNHKRKIAALATLQNTVTTSLQQVTNLALSSSKSSLKLSPTEQKLFDLGHKKLLNSAPSVIDAVAGLSKPVELSKKGVPKKKRGRKPKAPPLAQSLSEQNTKENVEQKQCDQTSDINTHFEQYVSDKNSTHVKKEPIETHQELETAEFNRTQYVSTNEENFKTEPKIKSEMDNCTASSEQSKSQNQSVMCVPFVSKSEVSTNLNRVPGQDGIQQSELCANVIRESLSSPHSSRSFSRENSQTPSLGCRTPHRVISSPLIKTPPAFVQNPNGCQMSNPSAMNVQGNSPRRTPIAESPISNFNLQGQYLNVSCSPGFNGDVHVQGMGSPESACGDIQTRTFMSPMNVNLQVQTPMTNMSMQGSQSMNTIHMTGHHQSAGNLPMRGPINAIGVPFNPQREANTVNMPGPGTMNMPPQGPHYRLGVPIHPGVRPQFAPGPHSPHFGANFQRHPNVSNSHCAPISDFPMAQMQNEHFAIAHARMFSQQQQHPGHFSKDHVIHDSYNFTDQWPQQFAEQKPKKKRVKRKKPKEVIKSNSVLKINETAILKSDGVSIKETASSVKSESETPASFLDNPTAFMAQQTAIVNSKMPTTSPTYKTPPASENMVKTPDKSSTNFESNNKILLEMANSENRTIESKEKVDTRTELVKALEEDGLRKSMIHEQSKAVAALTFTTAVSNSTTQPVEMGNNSGQVSSNGKTKADVVVTSNTLGTSTVMSTTGCLSTTCVSSGHTDAKIAKSTTVSTSSAVSSMSLTTPPVRNNIHIATQLPAPRMFGGIPTVDQSSTSASVHNNVIRGRYRLGSPANPQDAFPASHMLSAAARANQNPAFIDQSQMIVQNQQMVLSQHPQEMHQSQPMMNSQWAGHRFANGVAPPNMQMRPGMPMPMRPPMHPRATNPGTMHSGPQGGKSPIQMVQNMISGLQTAQPNPALVAAMTNAENSRRRRKSTSSDGSGRSSVRPPSTHQCGPEIEFMPMQQHQVIYDQAGHFHYQPVHVVSNKQMSLTTVQQSQQPNIVLNNQIANGPQSVSMAVSGALMVDNNPGNQMVGIVTTVANSGSLFQTGSQENMHQTLPTNISTSLPSNDTQSQQTQLLLSPGQHNTHIQQITPPQIPSSLHGTQIQIGPGNQFGIGPGSQFVQVHAAVGGVNTVGMQIVSNGVDPAAVNQVMTSIAPNQLPSQSGELIQHDGGVYIKAAPNTMLENMTLTGSMIQNDANMMPSHSSAMTSPSSKSKNRRKVKAKDSKVVKKQGTKPVLNSTIAKILESARREMELKAQGQNDQKSQETSSNIKTNNSVYSHFENPTTAETTNLTETESSDLATQSNSAAQIQDNSHIGFSQPPESNEDQNKQNAVSFSLRQTCTTEGEQNINSKERASREDDVPLDHVNDMSGSVDISQNEPSTPVVNNGHEECIMEEEPMGYSEHAQCTETSPVNTISSCTDSNSPLQYAPFVHSHYRDMNERLTALNGNDPHSDLFSTSYAIRTPRVFTSAKVRSAARILRKARMRKIKRSFPGQIGGLSSSPNSEDMGHSDLTSAMIGLDRRHHDADDDEDDDHDVIDSNDVTMNLSSRRLNKKPSYTATRIDKNFNSCVDVGSHPNCATMTADCVAMESPTHSSRDQGSDFCDIDSAHNSNSEMDTSRSSQSSDGSGIGVGEGIDGRSTDGRCTDDSGINCDGRSEGEEKTLKRSYDESDDEALEPALSPRELNIGDLVWGQSRGHPSWPGKLVHATDVKTPLQRENGKLWVRWFGNHSVSQEEPCKLKTLSEGLEAHFKEQQNCRRGRKLNSNLERAIQEAMSELDRQTNEPTSDEQTNVTTALTNREHSSIKEHVANRKLKAVCGGSAKKKKR